MNINNNRIYNLYNHVNQQLGICIIVPVCVSGTCVQHTTYTVCVRIMIIQTHIVHTVCVCLLYMVHVPYCTCIIII